MSKRTKCKIVIPLLTQTPVGIEERQDRMDANRLEGEMMARLERQGFENPYLPALAK